MKKYIIEAVLIIFSVLFALFINKLFESYKTNNEKKIALESIFKEIERNSEILGNWNEHHVKIHGRITSVIKGTNDSLRMKLLKYPSFNIDVLTENKSFIKEILTNTAWETAKSTGIIAEFDFETTQKLTEVYAMQDMVMNKTVDNILEYLFDPKSRDIKDVDNVLIQFHLLFREIIGQEETLTACYQVAIEELRK